MKKIISFLVGIVCILAISSMIGLILGVPIYDTVYEQLREEYIDGYYSEKEIFEEQKKREAEEEIARQESTEVNISDEKKEDEPIQETAIEELEELEENKKEEAKAEIETKQTVHVYKKEIVDRLEKGEYVDEILLGEHRFSYGKGNLILNLQKNSSLGIKIYYNTGDIEFMGTIKSYRLILPAIIFIFIFACYLLVYVLGLILYLLKLLRLYLSNQELKRAAFQFADGEDMSFERLPTYLNIFELLAIRLGNYILDVDREIFDEYYAKRKNDSVLVGFYRSYYVNGSRSDGWYDQYRFADRIKECIFQKLYAEDYVKEKRDFKRFTTLIKDLYYSKIKKIEIHKKNPQEEKDRLSRNMNRVSNLGIIILVALIVLTMINFWLLLIILFMFTLEMLSYKVRYTLKGKYLKYKLKEFEKKYLKFIPEEELTIEEAFYKKVIEYFPYK